MRHIVLSQSIFKTKAFRTVVYNDEPLGLKSTKGF